jgi:transcriptional regulator with XRE-family HTH domain
MYDLGFRLKQLRKSRKIMQRDLARKISKSVSAISSYESNAQMPPLDVLISIATTLGVSLDQLVGFTNDETYSTKPLTPKQKELVKALWAEFLSPSNSGTTLSPEQMSIIQKLFDLFSHHSAK